MPILRLFLVPLVTALWLCLPVRAQDLPALQGPVLLTVAGLDPAEFPGGQLELDIAMLRAMGATQITTTTIWTDGSHVYTGVLVKTLARHVKSGDKTLRFHAINDYSVDIPAQDMSEIAPLLAYEMNGAPMPVRDKGPLWVIYPYDAGSEYRSDTIFSRSIWQLDRIDVVQ